MWLKLFNFLLQDTKQTDRCKVSFLNLEYDLLKVCNL